MKSDIDALRDQVLFAHERIERLTKENNEFRLLIRALLQSNEDVERLVKAIQSEKELATTIALNAAIPDASVEHIEQVSARAIALVRFQKRE